MRLKDIKPNRLSLYIWDVKFNITYSNIGSRIYKQLGYDIWDRLMVQAKPMIWIPILLQIRQNQKNDEIN